jgi:hypothetical protein
MSVSPMNRIKKYTIGFRFICFIGVLLFLFCSTFSSPQTPSFIPYFTPQEFTSLIWECSEPSGYFSTDTWVSNELTYLDVLEPLDRYKVKGGVYIGVGPDQNFTYITAIKPELAFIVDIREQNRMQHLYFKLLFELAETRAEFLSLLFSKPLDPKKDTMLKKNHNIDSLVIYLYQTSSDPKMHDKTRKQVLELLKDKYGFQLTLSEQSELNYVIDAFYEYSIDITYNGYRRSWYPTIGSLLQARTPKGEQKNPFNSDEDYQYLRKMNLENRIVPITGNFAGGKALKAIAQYLINHKKTVTAFYVSNVEEYVIGNYYDWQQWVVNMKAMPTTDTSVIIRWTHTGGGSNQMTQLQFIKTFLKNYDEGKYRTYSDLIWLDYIK